MIVGRGGGGVTVANGFAEYEMVAVGVGVAGLIAEVLTRLSRLTRAEFSPRNDCGVFLTAPVLVGRFSPMPPKSNGSGDSEPPLFTGCGLDPSLFLLVITSNSSRSLSGLTPELF